MTLVLASGSTSRKKLLTAAGVPFIADPADLDEDALIAGLKGRGADAMQIASELAGQKALCVSRRHPGRLVLGGDSVIALGVSFISAIFESLIIFSTNSKKLLVWFFMQLLQIHHIHIPPNPL